MMGAAVMSTAGHDVTIYVEKGVVIQPGCRDRYAR